MARRNPVTEVVNRLRFVSSPAPAIYLNETLVREMFIANLGSINSFTEAAGGELSGSVGVSLISIGGSRSTESQIEYDMTNPLAQALVLHSALGAEGHVATPAVDTPVGTFIEAVGTAYFPTLGQPRPVPDDHREAAEAVIGESTRQLEAAEAFGARDAQLLPMLLVQENNDACGSIVDRRHIRPGYAASYLGGIQICFGIMERVAQHLPLFTLLYMRAYV
jgi:hypothetical protein